MNFSLNLFKFYDLGGPLSRNEIIDKINKLDIKSDKMEKYQFDSEKGEPDYINYPEPISFNIEKKLSNDVEIEIFCKVFSYGALSLKTELKPDINEVKSIKSFYYENDLIKKIEKSFNQIYNIFFHHFTDDFKKEYRSKNNFTNLYPVYCISDTDYNNVEKLIESNKEVITELLIGLNEEKEISKEQINNVLKYKTRFYKEDYSIIHWNGALTVDNDAEYDDLLYIIELANIQFIKLRAYDDYIDNYLSEYLNLTKKKFRKGLDIFNPISNMINNITKMRVELEQITDMMDNFEKFFGKWYMAKIYYLASSAFEIPRWKKLIESRLDTVDDLYTMINNEKNRKKMLFLNFLTLLLFVLWFFI